MAHGESVDRSYFLTQLSPQNTCQFVQRETKLSYSQMLLKHILYCGQNCRMALHAETLLSRTDAINSETLSWSNFFHLPSFLLLLIVC